MRFLIVTLMLAFAAGGACCGNGRAGDAPAGNWKMTIFEDGQQVSFWIITLDEKDGKTTGQAQSLKNVPPTSLESLKVDGDVVRFVLKIKNGPTFDYEGKLPRLGAKKTFGSLSRSGSMIPVVLEATTAKNSVELSKELLTRTPNDPRAFAAVFDVIANAKEHKITPKETQELAESSLKAAEAYGPRWQLNHSLKLVEALQKDPQTSEIAIEVARRAEKQLDPKAPLDTQLRLLSILAEALKQAKRGDEAKELDTRVAKLEDVAYAEHVKAGVGFEVAKAPTRKEGGRRVLVELFTGAQCPPCVAADVAFDAVGQSYPTTDVVLLQYHLHIPAPDPLASADTEARFDYYAETYSKTIRGTPAIVFDGKPDAPGGGGVSDAPEKFKEYQDVLTKKLAKPATASVTASAVRTGDKIDIKASVQDLETPGAKTRLRLALVEDWARYKGRNGLTYHHHIVRALPGGVKGFPLDKKSAEHSATVDVQELRKTLNKYLDESYPDGPRPQRLGRLHVVAFVQNDETTEVLQAIEVPVREE